MLFSERPREAWPAGAALELRAAVKERKSAQPASEGAGALLIEERSAEGRFRPVLKQYVALLLGQLGRQLLKLIIGGGRQIEARDGGGHGSSLQSERKMGMRRPGFDGFLRFCCFSL